MADFLVDNNLPHELIDWLADRGLIAFHVRNLGLASSNDMFVWSYAVRRNLAIITKDRDFDRIATQAKSDAVPVFRLRVGNATMAQLFSWLGPRLDELIRYGRLSNEEISKDIRRVIVID